jgi:hypothetical protein
VLPATDPADQSTSYPGHQQTSSPASTSTARLAGFFQPASGPVQVRQDALTCQHRHRHDLLLWGRRRRQCHPLAHQCDPRVNVQILTGQPITDGIGRASRERPASEV